MELKKIIGFTWDLLLIAFSLFGLILANVFFSHIQRTGNALAHFLAQLATTDPDKVWMEDVPSDASSLYFSDIVS